MKKPIDILGKYDIILFDMDGVVTSEQQYWNSSALTAHEYINSDVYYGDRKLAPADIGLMRGHIAEIRNQLFCNDDTIRLLKERGVNSNWDLTYLTIAAALLLRQNDKVVRFNRVHSYLSELNMNAFEMYDFIGKELAEQLGLPLEVTRRNGELWIGAVSCFQEWYLGDELFKKINGREPLTYGKRGFINDELPLHDLDRITEFLETLHNSGKTLGVGTGRIFYEIEMPFNRWDIMKYFDPNRLICYSDIEAAEAKLSGVTLSKPHPYMFLKGVFGKDYPDADIVSGNYDKEELRRALVVGDAGADILAAQAAGIDFAAVLTGVSGENARQYFVDNNADYIFSDVLELVQ